jgi:hypothetical protein
LLRRGHGDTAWTRAGLPVEGRKNVATRGLVFPTTEEEALWTRGLQARRRRAFRWQLQTTFVRQQLDAANLAEQLDAANLAEQLDTPVIIR